MIQVRSLGDRDREAYARLLRESPDTGRVQFARHLVADPPGALHGWHPDATVAVAEQPGGPLCGTATVSFATCRLSGQLVPSAYLSGLAVHPAQRRQGVARALTEWCVRAAQQRLGEAGLVYALIQRGNEGSLRTVRAWLPALVGQITVSPVPVRERAPEPLPGLRVRPARPQEWEELADRLNAFNAAFALAPHCTAASLSAWQAAHLAGQPWRHYLVVTDDVGNILAGLGVTELARLSVLRVVAMPPALRLLNAAVRVVPRDGTLRLLQTEKAFFLPGREQAARQLFQTARFLGREWGSHLSVTFDPRGPLARMYALPRWLPTTAMSVALRAPLVLAGNALLHPDI